MNNSMSKLRFVFFICVWAIWRTKSYPAPSSTQPQPLPADPPMRYLVDEVIVCVDDTGKGDENVEIHFEDVKLIRRFSTGVTCFTAAAKSRRKRATDEPVEEYLDEELNAWRSLDGIVLAKQHERVPRVLKTTTPNDTYWSSMWPVNGDVSPSQKVTEVWDMGYNGSGVIVAVVDNGVEMDHPDLAANLAGSGHLDLVDNDTDVTPPASSSHNHGTRVSGFVSAEKDNQECVVGLAYGAKLIGIRLFSAGDFPLEANEALAFSHGINDPTLTIDIFSSSWGPPDQYRYWPIGEVPLMALEDGIKLGREGKGAIYVFAAGNGSPNDNCNAEGYANSIYTVTITSVGNDGTPPDYSEICAPALAALYSGSDDKTLRSTSNIHQCVSGLKGTSYSAPQGAAIIALALQANPALTWRDIQHLIVLSTTTEGLSDTYGWTLNGAGKNVSQILGFGLLQAEDIVQCATGWATIADNKTYEATERVINSALDSSTTTVSDKITISNTNVGSIEHVQVLTTFQCSDRKRVSMNLTSPSGTTSFLMTERRYDTTSSDNVTFTFMSVHFWGESPDGDWTISMSIPLDQTGTLYSWKLTIRGTSSDLQTEIDSCCTQPCLNNGTCNKQTKYNYNCTCVSCYFGDLCQSIDSCCKAGDPCQNNGTCNRLSDTAYDCTCPTCYSGAHCEVKDICCPNPCNNSGTCASSDNVNYTCTCAFGYTGINCDDEIKFCESGPCLNNGTCTDVFGSYKCNCTSECLGINCELCESGVIRPCDTNPCKNGGSCKGDDVLFKCSCIALCFKDDCSECNARLIVWCVMMGFGYFMTLLLPAKTGILILYGQISTGTTDTLHSQNRTTKEAKADTTGPAKTDTHAQNSTAKSDTTGTGKTYTASHGQNKTTKNDTSYISQGGKEVTNIDTGHSSYAQNATAKTYTAGTMKTNITFHEQNGITKADTSSIHQDKKVVANIDTGPPSYAQNGTTKNEKLYSKNETGTTKGGTGTTSEIRTAISSQGDNDRKKLGTNSTTTLGEVVVHVENDRCLMVTSLVIPILGICCFVVAFCFVHPVLEIDKLPDGGKWTLNGIGILLAVGLLIYMFWKWPTVGIQRSRRVTPFSE